MDLTRLYNFTTPELRDEAERLGVRDTYAMSRGQLIQAIRERVEQPTSRKRGLFGKVVGFAKWAVQTAAEAEAGAGTDETGSGGGWTGSVSAKEAASGPEPVSAKVAEHGAGAGTAAPSASEPASGSSSSRAPAGVFANNGGLFEEPIPTRTMARILAEQGHFKRSLAIYASLLDEEPDNRELIAEAEAVREEAKARRSHAPS